MDSPVEECINACWLLKHRVEWVIETTQVADCFPVTALAYHPPCPQPELREHFSMACLALQLHTGVRAAMTEEKVWLRDAEVAQILSRV